MKKIKKRNIKRSQKKIIILSVSISLVVIASVFGVIKFREYREKVEREELIAEIKKYYNKYVVVNKKTNLYNKDLKQIGVVEAKNDFEIVKPKNNTFPYYRIKGTDLYLYYKDVDKENELKKRNVYEHYINLNKVVTTKKNVKLYLDNKPALTLNQSIDASIKFINGNNYYINYLDRVYRLDKEQVTDIKNIENSPIEEADYISILNYNTVANQCSTTDCVSMQKIEEQINYLNTEGYYPINLEEYKNWLSGNLRLKKKAIFIISSNETEEMKSLNDRYNHMINIVTTNEEIKFVDNNNKTTRESKIDSLSRYMIKTTTSLEEFKKMVAGEHVEETKKVSNNNQQGPRIPVLNYHFFYDGSASEICNENICLDVGIFRQHLNYLRDNNYKTLTIEEYRAWLYKEIELPEKSVLITIDDGALGTGKHNGNKLIPILEEYNMHATLFLITGWWDINNYRSKYLDVESHTYDMHSTGSCGKAQMICANHNELVNDLKKSISVTGSTKAFCFPFYTFDEEAINAVKNVGFQMAFVGGNRKSSRSDNKYKIPRYPIYKNTTMDSFIKMVN